jgi:hypothetical protein
MFSDGVPDITAFKECALGSARVARQGFRKLEQLAPDDILKIMPQLPVP